MLEIGKETYDKIVHDLYKKYHYYLPKCYDHHKYLNEIFKDLYSTAHNVVVEKINKQLEEFSYHKSISNFVKILINNIIIFYIATSFT